MKDRNNKVTVSKQVSLLVEATKCTDVETARALIMKAFEVMNCNDELLTGRKIDLIVVDAVIDLIRGVNPQDTVEMILASQFVATHFQAMNRLAGDTPSDTSHGMMLMRLSHQALETLQKYRSKGSNINVNYFVHNEGQAMLQTNIGKNLEKK
jgi:hypothetical protein